MKWPVHFLFWRKVTDTWLYKGVFYKDTRRGINNTFPVKVEIKNQYHVSSFGGERLLK